MTPERAAYHYLMLTVGLREEFDRDFDEALEKEDPLPHPHSEWDPGWRTKK